MPAIRGEAAPDKGNPASFVYIEEVADSIDDNGIDIHGRGGRLFPGRVPDAPERRRELCFDRFSDM